MASYEGNTHSPTPRPPRPVRPTLRAHSNFTPVEHNIQPEMQSSGSSRRPDMSTFFAKLSQINTSSSDGEQHNNPHAQPTPVDMRATFGLLADSYYQIQASISSADHDPAAEHQHHSELLSSLISELEASAENPPNQVSGVSQEFLDGLERVDKKKLGDESCPICGEKYKDDKYPLVVQLPCHPGHWFDLECVAPWLRLKGTCPLDRKEVGKRKEVNKEVKKAQEEDSEEEWDDMIA